MTDIEGLERRVAKLERLVGTLKARVIDLEEEDEEEEETEE
jgi:hypothetical protein